MTSGIPSCPRPRASHRKRPHGTLINMLETRATPQARRLQINASAVACMIAIACTGLANCGGNPSSVLADASHDTTMAAGGGSGGTTSSGGGAPGSGGTSSAGATGGVTGATGGGTGTGGTLPSTGGNTGTAGTTG